MKTYKRLVFAASVAAVVLTGCGSKEAKESISTGIAQIEEEKYEDAVATFHGVLETGKCMQDAYRGLGISYLKMEMYPEAEEAFNMALLECNGKISEIEKDISFYLAEAQLRNGEIEKSIETYDRLLEIKEGDVNVYFMRGIAYLKNGEIEKAIEGFEYKINENPKNYDIYCQIYSLLLEAGEQEKAIEYAKRGLTVEGGENQTYYFGILNCYVGNYEEAITYLSTQEAREKTDSYMYLGQAYEKTGDYEQAFLAYQTYMEQNKEANVQIYSSMGEYYMNQKKYEQALDCFEKGLALATGKEKQRLLFDEAVVYEYLLDFDTAREKMAAYVEQYPEDETAERENRFLQTRGVE